MKLRSIKEVKTELERTPGVTFAQGELFIIELTSSICARIAKLLGFPDTATCGLPQLVGQLIESNLRVEAKKDAGTQKDWYIVYVPAGELPRLWPTLPVS